MAARVLITDGIPHGRVRSTLAGVRALAAAGHIPYVTLSGPRSLASVSRYCRAAFRVPPANDSRYPTSIRELAEELAIDSVLVASDAALIALRAPGHLLVDKEFLADRAATTNLAVPWTITVADGTELAQVLAELPRPVVVKSRRKEGPDVPAASVIRQRDDETPWLRATTPLVVQPLLEGPMTAVFGIMHDDRILALGAQRYIRTWPVDAGVACAAVTTPLPPDIDIDDIATLLHGHSGIFQVQLIGSHVIDVNPRLYGSLPLAARAGLNLPAMWCALEAGHDVAFRSARPEVWYRWLEGEARWSLHAARRGDLPAAIGVFRPRRPVVRSDWVPSDPRPTVSRLVAAFDRRSQRAPCDADHDASEFGYLPDLTDRERVLLAGLSGRQRSAHAVPSPEVARRRERARAILDATTSPDELPTAILSPAWSSDIDAGPDVEGHLPARLRDHTLPLADLIHRLGSSGEGQWLLHEDGAGLARLDLASRPDTHGDLQKVIERVRRNRGTRAREVLELRRLLQGALDVEPHPALRDAARLERSLGGGLLDRFDHRRRPSDIWLRLRPRRPRRRSPLVVAFSGLDGSGKSTQTTMLRDSLQAAGLPTTIVWTRPGMHLDWLHPLRRHIKRILRMPSEPGLRAMGRDDRDLPTSRVGVVGFVWRLVVMLAAAVAARRGVRRERGVVILDRHVLDALATLHAVYRARWRRWDWFVRLLLPRADLSFVLELPASVAAARKPDEVFSEALLEAQAEVYDRATDIVPNAVVLDSTRPAHELADTVLRYLLGPPAAGHAQVDPE